MVTFDTISWMMSSFAPPIVVGVVAGLWLARRGHRVIGTLFLLWSVIQVSWIVLFYWGWLGDIVQEQLSAISGADRAEVFAGVLAAYRLIDVLAVTAFVAVISRRRAGDR